MVLPRFSQLGARFLKESGIGQFCVTRRGCVKWPSSHYLYPMKSLPFSTAVTSEAHEESSEQKEKITVTFVDKDGEERVIQVPIGISMLEAAHENDIELEGACEGSLACSTCHVIVMDMEYYNKLEDPADEENDMLDLAFGLTETSRLGCQVIAKPELDGMRLALPAATRNFAVDGRPPEMVGVEVWNLACEICKTKLWQEAVEEPGSSREVIAPKTGMKFKTLEELCEFYNRYAQHLGFATKIKGSSRNRAYIQIMCWKGRKRDVRRTDALAPRPTLYTSCPALLKVRLCRFDGMYHLKEVVLDHNHELNPLRMHFYRDENMVGAGVKKREAHVSAAREESLALVEREWMSSVDEIQWLKLEKEDAEALHQFFRRMQANNSNFFYLINIDREGHLRNVFWADGRSRAAYRYFGDVIFLDTSCLSSKYNVPFVTFIGVNHHGQPLLMGCGLLSDENTRTYIWLFQAWLSCMSGQSPNAIITDQGKAIQAAVAQVFPGCPHRQCLWQIMKRIPDKLEGCAEYKEIKRAFKKTVYDSLSAHEFEQEWRKMIEKHSLVYNEWLRLLYQDRYHWAPIFVKDKFWAGLSTTRRGENMDFFFDGHLESNTSLKQFLDKYEMAMESKYETEALADFESFHKVPPLFTQFYVEEQLSKIYTIDIFVKFQDEVKALVYCHPSLIRKDGLMYIFEVRERIRGKEGKMMEQKNYEVMFNANDQEVRCICHSFQYRGILCRHALSVFNFQDIDEIPSQYIVERWKKDFKGVHAVVCPPYEMVANGPMERYENLYKHCLKLAEVGTITDDKYQFMLKIVNEAMEKLLEDTFICKGKQVKIVMTEPTIDCNNVDSSAINGNKDMGKEIEEIHDPKEARKKGRKRRKEPAETLNSNKEKEQVSQTNAPVFLHPPLPLNYQHPFANPSWAQWSFQHMNQVQPSNLIYYAAAPVNHPQFGLFLNRDQLGDPRFSSSSGLPWSSQQILEKTQNPVALPGPKKKKKRKNDVVELSP